MWACGGATGEYIEPWRRSSVREGNQNRGKEGNIGLEEDGLKRKGPEDDHGRGVRARERKIVNMVKFPARNEQGTRDKEKVAWVRCRWPIETGS